MEPMVHLNTLIKMPMTKRQNRTKTMKIMYCHHVAAPENIFEKKSTNPFVKKFTPFHLLPFSSLPRIVSSPSGFTRGGGSVAKNSTLKLIESKVEGE